MTVVVDMHLQPEAAEFILYDPRETINSTAVDHITDQFVRTHAYQVGSHEDGTHTIYEHCNQQTITEHSKP